MGLCDRSWARNGKRGASVQSQGDPQSVSTRLLGAITYFPLPVVLHLQPENLCCIRCLGKRDGMEVTFWVKKHRHILFPTLVLPVLRQHSPDVRLCRGLRGCREGAAGVGRQH